MKVHFMNINRSKIVDIVSALVSAACAVLCTFITGCKMAFGEMSVKDFGVQIEIPTEVK